MNAAGEGALPPLDESDRRELLRIARLTLDEWLRNGSGPAGSTHRAPLLARASAFVSIEVDGRLRGCVGRLEPDGPLYRTVIDLVVSAATADPRFEPVRVDELDLSRIEISVLSERKRIADFSSLAIGQDGLVITRGARRGLLLPKVAVEHAWDVETFLAETCRKAGLPGAAWRETETVVERFSAEVFAEPRRRD